MFRLQHERLHKRQPVRTGKRRQGALGRKQAARIPFCAVVDVGQKRLCESHVAARTKRGEGFVQPVRGGVGAVDDEKGLRETQMLPVRANRRRRHVQRFRVAMVAQNDEIRAQDRVDERAVIVRQDRAERLFDALGRGGTRWPACADKEGQATELLHAGKDAAERVRRKRALDANAGLLVQVLRLFPRHVDGMAGKRPVDNVPRGRPDLPGRAKRRVPLLESAWLPAR